MKRTLAAILCLCLFAAILCVPAFATGEGFPTSGTCGENLTWELDRDTGVLTISGTGDMYNWDHTYKTAPWHPHFDYIKTVLIGEGVTNIGWAAFDGCYNITAVTIPNSVTSIQWYAFTGCSKLTNITIPDSVTSIGGYAFYYCFALTSITIPKGVTAIEDCTFGSCQSLTSVTLPDTITRIGANAFSGCIVLTNITIPAAVTSIEMFAFSGCPSLMSVYFRGNAPALGRKVFITTEQFSGNDISIPGMTLYYIEGTEGWTTPTWREEQYPTAPWDGVNFIENPFRDIKSGKYYYMPVLWAAKNGVTTGTGKTVFSPDDGCTRAQVVTFLWRAAGQPDPVGSENPFADVKENAYYRSAILWAVENGITNGTSGTTFSPEDTCTRAQIVTFLWRFEQKAAPAAGANQFKDVPAEQYYYDAVLWAVENGITNGTSATTFSPDDTCTRAQVVTFLYRDMVE